MKIYIKTEMTEMPERCGRCPYHTSDFKETNDFCQCHQERIIYEIWKGRPAWCPLRTEKEIKEEL